MDRSTEYPAYGCVGSDTNPQAAGAAAEPPPPPTVGCVSPAVVTITIAIVTHKIEVCAYHNVVVVEPVVLKLDVLEPSMDVWVAGEVFTWMLCRMKLNVVRMIV